MHSFFRVTIGGYLLEQYDSLRPSGRPIIEGAQPRRVAAHGRLVLHELPLLRAVFVLVVSKYEVL